MSRATSPRERRLIAVLVLTTVMAAAYYLVVAPIVGGFRSRAEQREALILQHSHNLRTITSIPRLRHQADLRSIAAATFVFEVANADADAGRERLKDRLQAAIERAGGEFRIGDDSEARPGWARARASARLTLPQLAAALTSLQNTQPWLIIESVTVTANDALVTGQSSHMDVDIDASIPLRLAAVR